MRKKTQKIMEFNKDLEDLCQNMIETMHHYNGIGIAAPQVGKSLQLFIADPTPEEEHENKAEPLIVINPILTPISKDNFQTGTEGCLSIPTLYADVKRYFQVKVEAVNQYNKPFTITLEGLAARVLQHEYDHLQGILFTDKVLAQDRKMVEEFLYNFRNNHA